MSEMLNKAHINTHIATCCNMLGGGEKKAKLCCDEMSDYTRDARACTCKHTHSHTHLSQCSCHEIISRSKVM